MGLYSTTSIATSFWLAIGLLTRLPTPTLQKFQGSDAGRSVLFYPLVGLIIGIILYLPILFFADNTNASPLLLAAIITTLWAIITGGLHLDGLADSADAWLGGMGDAERIQRIMKDPLVGSAGVIAIVCLLLLKVAALTHLIEQGLGGLIILAPIIGRSLILLLFLTTPYVRKQGMANDMVDYLPKKHTIYVAIASLLVCIFYSFWGVVFSLLGLFFLRRLMQKLLAGCTGDTIGATVEIGEMLFLLGIGLTI